jgi:hypothetical protein
MTPKNHTRGLSVNFNSEKRSITTPMVQATRATSLTSAITDPARKQNITSWLENTPTGLSGPNQLGINTPETVKRLVSILQILENTVPRTDGLLRKTNNEPGITSSDDTIVHRQQLSYQKVIDGTKRPLR